jgi:hypothetical protein
MKAITTRKRAAPADFERVEATTVMAGMRPLKWYSNWQLEKRSSPQFSINSQSVD